MSPGRVDSGAVLYHHSPASVAAEAANGPVRRSQHMDVGSGILLEGRKGHHNPGRRLQNQSAGVIVHHILVA